MTGETEAATVDHVHAPATADSKPEAVVTRMTFDAPPERVWEGLVFYEELKGRPPLHLRLLLPVPIRNEGKISEVGDEATCLYETGQLLKRITRIEDRDVYEFEVAQQSLSIGGGMRLCGGRYQLQDAPGGRTEVSVETKYVSTKWPRWFWKPIERLVCHWFHRYLLGSMRRTIESK